MKTYCTAPFIQIFSNNADRYKLCCYADGIKHINDKYRPSTHGPFEFFLSPEMDEIRRKMLNNEPVHGCNICYDMEARGAYSYRQLVFKSDHQRIEKVDKVNLKTRVWGTSCNLNCYMCLPMNSSTRRVELKKMTEVKLFSDEELKATTVSEEAYEHILGDVLKNIHMVKYIKITGGEPFLIPRHYKFLHSIPDEYAKDIVLAYDTNLTTLEYKQWSFFDFPKKFKNIQLFVSVDHLQDRLGWIRHPIDWKLFEENIVSVKPYIYMFQVAVSMLNARDLEEIRQYYEGKYDIPMMFPSIVRFPQILSIRHLPDDVKLELIERYEATDYRHRYKLVLNELKRQRDPKLDKVFQAYIKACDKQRDMNANELFGWKIYE